MSDSERWAWWTLGVVVLTIAAYGAFVAFLGHGPATSSVFSMLAPTALPRVSRRHFTHVTYDERDKDIGRKSVRAGLAAFWLAFGGLILGIEYTKGWLGTLKLPVWALGELLMWAAILVLAVQAVTVIALYRGVSRV
jgi:uncharacterized membrane protein